MTDSVAPGLGSCAFTIETWFKRQGAGVATSTGASGIADAVPLLTKGAAQAEASNVDMNYFLGIRQSTNHLVADFEEGNSAGGTAGLNHPVEGTTAIVNDTWYHAAATYDGQNLRVYLNGNLENTLTLAAARPPRFDSIQHAGLATSITSVPAVAGFFDGVLDEARVWSLARLQTQIQATKDTELPAATGLLGRWGMNEGSGTAVGDSSGGGNNGTTINDPTG